jgi:integrase
MRRGCSQKSVYLTLICGRYTLRGSPKVAPSRPVAPAGGPLELKGRPPMPRKSRASGEPDFADPACRTFKFTAPRIAAACRAVAEGAVPTDGSATGRVQWRDADTPGLFLRVTANGTGTFTLFYKRDGRPIRRAIGPVDVVGLAEARATANALRHDRSLAAQVQPRQRARGQGPTIGEAFDAYITAAEAGTFKLGRRRQAITDRTAQGYRDVYKATLKDHAGESLEWLAENVVALHQRIGTAGKGKGAKPARPYQANRMMQTARNIFTFAAAKGWWTKPNPCIDPATGGMVAKFPEHHRERILSDAEEDRLGKALIAEPDGWRHLFALGLLTGRRMAAVCSMRWADVDLGRKVWTVPRVEMKGRKAAHGLALDPDAVAILRRRQADTGDQEWVFPAPRSPGPVRVWKTAWGRIRKAAGLDHKDRARRVRPHDLRRSWGTRLVEAGVPTVTVNAALGNSPSSVSMTAKVYMHVPDQVQVEAIGAAFKRRQARKAKAKRSRRKAQA